MPDPPSSHDSELASKLQKTLDSHGYSFQYAVLRKLEEVFRENRGGFCFDVAEFPVNTGRFDTKIDFVLRLGDLRFFVVAECKRANPAVKNWCFVRAPMVVRNQTRDALIVERITTGSHPETARATGERLCSIDAYHIGFEIKDPRNKGDERGGSERKAIEECAGQVLKSANGLASLLPRLLQQTIRTEKLGDETISAWIMPVVFTTANLYTTNVDISAADLDTGKLPKESVTLCEQKQLFLQYATSPSLKHSLPSRFLSEELSGVLMPEYLRTIAIVNSEGIGDFMRSFADEARDSISRL